VRATNWTIFVTGPEHILPLYARREQGQAREASSGRRLDTTTETPRLTLEADMTPLIAKAKRLFNSTRFYNISPKP
jgi:hypothetical protein